MGYGSPSERSISDGTLGKRYTSYCLGRQDTIATSSTLALGFEGNSLIINLVLGSLVWADSSLFYSHRWVLLPRQRGWRNWNCLPAWRWWKTDTEATPLQILSNTCSRTFRRRRRRLGLGKKPERSSHEEIFHLQMMISCWLSKVGWTSWQLITSWGLKLRDLNAIFPFVSVFLVWAFQL